jgi:hypothetical protein
LPKKILQKKAQKIPQKNTQNSQKFAIKSTKPKKILQGTTVTISQTKKKHQLPSTSTKNALPPKRVAKINENCLQ